MYNVLSEKLPCSSRINVGNINGNDDILNELYGYNFLFLFNNGTFVKYINHCYLYILIMNINISECIRMFLKC